MMTNLFSLFDPSSSIMSLNWSIILISTLFIPTSMWKFSSSIAKMNKKMIKMFKKEVSFTLKKSEKSSEAMILLTLTGILLMNFLALYPQIFSLTSHIAVNLPLAVTFWLSLMMFGWMKNTNHMLIHLLPQGTPTSLMMFMVFIEMASNIIRPITLCVRLTANLIAGHLLMSLLGNALMNIQMIKMTLAIPIPMTLTILESTVVCIQAYVFTTLIALYVTETK